MSPDGGTPEQIAAAFVTAITGHEPEAPALEELIPRVES